MVSRLNAWNIARGIKIIKDRLKIYILYVYYIICILQYKTKLIKCKTNNRRSYNVERVRFALLNCKIRMIVKIKSKYKKLVSGLNARNIARNIPLNIALIVKRG